jgi:hypothetical protein
MRQYGVAALACAIALAMGRAVSAAAGDADASSGIFVSYTPTGDGGSLTLQQGDQLRVYAVSAQTIVRERESGQPWQNISFAQIAQGEPVALHVTGAGTVDRVDAEYTLVYARFVAARNDAIVTTSGTAYKLIGTAAIAGSSLELGTFLRLRVNPQDDTAFDLAASRQPFAGGSLAAMVTVTFTVTVPANTPPTDIVYLTADAQNWVPNAVRMSPAGAHVWTATLSLGQGSSLKYKYTRGSWPTAESNPAGIEIPNRSLAITKSGQTQTQNDTVVRWSDLPS